MKNIIFFFFVTLVSCNKKEKLFKLIDSKESGIEFNNKITENDSLNILDTEFIYNGGGVAVGDLNNDGLQDVYFCGSQVDNKLYLNQGNLKFKDITKISGTNKKTKNWSAGVSMIDLNHDGKLDIYVNNTFQQDSTLRENLLYINQGNNAQNIPIFKELGKKYGLNDNSHSASTAFFDYDNDGDLDAFIAVNFIEKKVYPNNYVTRTNDGSAPTRDKLLKNEFDKKLGHPVFKDVSIQAGINLAGQSHSVLTNDFNNDGWQDIYVANDYLSNDLIYINNQNGTFTNKTKFIFKHQSNSAMGSDVADINNDGQMDFISMEMLPNDVKRKKLMQSANNYTTYVLNKEFNYEYQYVRNTFQLNRGISPETNLPVFSDISFLANVEATDWSWTPLLADFDNDGHRDLLITNGYPKDVTDKDFGNFRNSINSSLITRQELLDMIPEVKVPNYIFKNNGDLSFSDKSKDWGLEINSFTNGTAYADFDNDGDLDFITNNINDKAFLYENTLNSAQKKNDISNFIRIKLNKNDSLKTTISSKVSIHFEGKSQFSELISTRGYLSNSEEFIHFGLGNSTKIDSVIILWPNGKKQIEVNPKINSINEFKYKPNRIINSIKKSNKFLQSIDNLSINLNDSLFENDFNDFNFQRTLPHKFSQNGPSLAAGDINGDGLEDFVVGGSSGYEATLYFQNNIGKFSKKSLNLKKGEKKEEDLGVLLFDADNDGDNDLYFVRGGYQFDLNDSLYKDILCVNDGIGNFKISEKSIPTNFSCGQTVKAADFDQDGDLDLFVGGRVKPKSYPLSDPSYILVNHTKNKDFPIFKDETSIVSKEISMIGMVSDALWTDFDNDNQLDLIIAGEWMPLTFFKNKNGKLINITKQSGIEKNIGWWNSLAPFDFDNDGDMDYVAGNYGKNLYFNCNEKEPMTIYSKDFDSNGSYDAFISCYLKDSTGKKDEYFIHSKEDMQKQLILIRRKFQYFVDFGRTKAKDVFTKDELNDVKKMQANYFETSIIINEGNGKFKLQKLPTEAQFAPIFGIITSDINQDGYEDILLTGNDYGMEIYQGRADAFYGQTLINDKKGGFYPIDFNKSGFYVPGEARAAIKINIKNEEHFLVSQNNDKLKIIKSNQKRIEKINLNEQFGVLHLKNGLKRKVEFNFGNTFLSQNGRFLNINSSIKSIELYDKSGKLTRKIQ